MKMRENMDKKTNKDEIWMKHGFRRRKKELVRGSERNRERKGFFIEQIQINLRRTAGSFGKTFRKGVKENDAMQRKREMA